MTDETQPMATTSTEESATSPSAHRTPKRLKKNHHHHHHEDQEQNRTQIMLEQQQQQIQLLREENARLKQADEASQERVQQLEESLAISNLMQVPLPIEELCSLGKELFSQLLEQATRANTRDEAEDWFQQLKEDLKKCPDIAKVAIFCPDYTSKVFLLAFACSKIHLLRNQNEDIGPSNEPFPHIDVFQSLVNACPSALLWVNGATLDPIFERSRCIDEIAGGFKGSRNSDRFHNYDLLLWVAEAHGWIFDLSKSFGIPAHTQLLENFCDHYSNVDTLRLFFELQPSLLKVQTDVGPNDGIYEFPMDIVMQNVHRVKAGDVKSLVRLMASNFPERLGMRDEFGHTPLHYACVGLVEAVNDPDEDPIDLEPKIENCRRAVAVLVRQYPQAVFVGTTDRKEELPIDLLVTRKRFEPKYHDSMILLLQAYYPRELTENMSEREDIRRSYSLVEERRALYGRVRVYLNLSSKLIAKFAKIAGPSGSSIGNNENDRGDNRPELIHKIYSAWADRHLEHISAKFKCVDDFERLKNELTTDSQRDPS